MDYDDCDHGMYDDQGNEYMKVEDHIELMDDFRVIAIDILKEMILAIDKDDKIALMASIDEMADHLGATI